jgi:hypothetical protein
MQPFQNTYEMVGTSYKYNNQPWDDNTLLPQRDPDAGLAGQKENWISQPSRYILTHEPTAIPPWVDGWRYFFWHYARGPNTVGDLSEVRDHFISSVLFADGHASKHDFTQAVLSRPSYPWEATAEWYTYEPARGVP